MRSVRPSRALSQGFWRGRYRDRPHDRRPHNIKLMELAARIRRATYHPCR
jgi:hypothetical protein